MTQDRTCRPWRTLAALAAACWLAMAGGALAQDKRSLPFNKQSVYNYFRQVEEARRALPDDANPELRLAKICELYPMLLKKSGYDFETTIQNAIQFGERGPKKLEDPRFLFLAGVFQVHPDVFLRFRLISQATRDAVVGYFR